MKIPNGHEVIQLFEQFSPKGLAMEGDKIGLQIGRLNKKVERIMIALDVLENVIDEAIEKNVQLIIAHHPIIYRPLKNLLTDTVQGKMIEKILKHDIAVYAAHTNLDVAKGGVNDLLANALELEDAEVLVPTFDTKLKKLVVFVPVSHAEVIRKVLGNAGAGFIGSYSHCSFSANGTGRFVPGENTSPFVGEAGRLEEVEEVRIETIIPEPLLKKTITAMIKAHPYEEVAYDVYPLENKGEVLGLGRIGKVREMTLGEFAEKVKLALEVSTVRVVGDLSTKIKKVAVLGGDGNKYFMNAKFQGADVYVTGDIYYHTAHDAAMQGLNMIDPGHNVEKVMKKGLTATLQKMCQETGYDVEIFPSEVNTDPFQFV
ncbi:Nif3-like dinuclear metal center hexameric protein [Bacillus sp. ISL-40]|uniref:Nif3-like dinuclear metal center hexameric protein n=1 Tax=unclassified Bacillus (in: firmicutes) TaxID=185979 RepID=UPI001BEA409D|nr:MULTISPECIES: Nif3-like dinuclear metal center hexameric protein [unclassified Bacillus (in: firmicutes)]MBT2698032.1 Nif3-like dinuclear metal center hexameric protein [Bacillus sp. ISL-40]MBT2721336.1 Nif3-like dinuclear metal center hexameric protein [Bacillus sp. ISL-46]